MIKKAFLSIIFLFFTTITLCGQNNIFVERFNARAVGMANIFTSLADDSTAIFYNPAGLGQFTEKNTYFNSMYANVHNLNIFHNYILSGSTRYNDDFGMGSAWVYERVNLDPEIWGQHRFFYGISYSLVDNNLAIGLTSKLILINTDFKEYDKVWGYGFDVGFLASSEEWKILFFDQNNIILKLGLILKDIYSPIKWDDQHTEKLPTQAAFGMSANFSQSFNLLLQFKSLKDNLTSFGLGGELFLLRAIHYQLDERLKVDDIALRLGYERESKIASATMFSAGIGVLAQNFSFDYGVVMQSDYFSTTHYFSINMAR